MYLSAYIYIYMFFVTKASPYKLSITFLYLICYVKVNEKWKASRFYRKRVNQYLIQRFFPRTNNSTFAKTLQNSVTRFDVFDRFISFYFLFFLFFLFFNFLFISFTFLNKKVFVLVQKLYRISITRFDVFDWFITPFWTRNFICSGLELIKCCSKTIEE